MINLLLNIIAIVLFIILTPINFLIVFYKYGYKNQYFLSNAIELDKFGNRSFRTLFNLTLIKKQSKNIFGNINETISSVLGKNQIDKTLTIIGWLVVYILWVIDYKYWFKGGHCINSIKK
jgi:hypothetical protein